MMDIITSSLFTTNAIKIAPHDLPFWYTSGTIGPYFINTHYLYGNDKQANELLEFINTEKSGISNFYNELTNRIITFYNKNYVFKNVIDKFYEKISKLKEFNECEYISGGERRDWFFSPIIADLSKKKSLLIYKDLKVFLDGKKIENLNNAKVCHICDLITQASSHKRAWIPAIKNINGKIILNCAVVDRNEGGSDFLESNHIKNYSEVIINKNFLKDILDNKIINDMQLDTILNFKNDPIEFGKNFIIKYPDFLINSYKDNNTKSKVIKFFLENPYNFNFNEHFKDLYQEILKHKLNG